MPRVILALALLLMTPTRASAAEWLRVETPNFIVFGELGEKRTREYAAEFERFREALGRVIRGAEARSAAPTLVFLFRDQRSFGPYRPEFNGKPIKLDGYFIGDTSLNTIMLAATDRDAALRTIYHEYSHLMLANVARGFPVWLNEGLADFYSTFEVGSDGRSATLGRPIESHLALLNTQRLLPIEDLVSVNHDSRLYNEGERRSVFYAQSWALVHLLRNGQPNRHDLFREYVRLSITGGPPVDTWRKVFGDLNINQHVQRYVAQQTMTGTLFTFDADIPQSAFTITKPDQRDVLAALGDMRRLATPDRVDAHIDGIPGPPTAYVAAVRGLRRIDRHEDKLAIPLLLEAVKSEDWFVRYRAAVGLQRIASQSSDGDSETAAHAAQAGIESVLSEKPDLPHAVALRAWLLGPSDEGLAAIKRARALAPGRDHYAIWQAQFHLERTEFKEARAILAPLMSPLNPRDIREYARSVMGRAVTAEQTLASSRTATDRASSPDRDAQAPGSEMNPGVVYVFREVRAGEQRIEGVLERIECPRIGLTLHVRADGRALRFTAASFDEVELIVYDQYRPGSISCGARTPPDRVYVTFKPGSAGKTADGIVVAIEFLPKSS